MEHLWPNPRYLGSTHAVVVVLADEDDRKVPELGQVERLRHLALIRRSVAVQGEVHAAVALVLVGESDASAQRNLEKGETRLIFKQMRILIR